METIDIDNLKVGDLLGWGAYGIVYKCGYENKSYALKKFTNPEKMFTQKFIHKIDALSKIKLIKSVLPEKMVLNYDETPVGYLTKKTEKFEFYDLPSISKKIQCLNNIKQSILELHDMGIIHTDIHSGNFLKKENKYFLCDFDNCAFGSYKPLLSNCSDSAHRFLKEVGLYKELDIYLLNLLTFAVVNDIDYNSIEFDIYNKEYGEFDNSDAISICDSLLLETNTINKEFLLDNIDIKKILER